MLEGREGVQQTSGVDGIVDPPEPPMHRVHRGAHLLLALRVVPLLEDRDVGVYLEAQTPRLLQARLVAVQDRDLRTALARKGEGHLAADAWCRL